MFFLPFIRIACSILLLCKIRLFSDYAISSCEFVILSRRILLFTSRYGFHLELVCICRRSFSFTAYSIFFVITLRAYNAHIPNQKFDSSGISVLGDITRRACELEFANFFLINFTYAKCTVTFLSRIT